MISASGYITEFNRETNFGYIQTQDDESNKQRFIFHLHSLKKNSRRYATKTDALFVGELFDFDIIKRTDEAEEEAINIRHRVLKCPIVGCSRLKAFTYKKALNDHIESKHLRVKKVADTSSQEVVTSKPQVQKKKKAEKSAKLQPFIVDLIADSKSTLGRFIGKSGVNLKALQQENNVQLKILAKSMTSNQSQNSNVQIQVKPYRDNINIDLVRKQLQSAWKKAVREQKEEDDKFKKIRLQQVYKREEQLSPSELIPTEKDTRHATAFTMSGDELMVQRRRKRRLIGSTLKIHKERSNLEGHRCAATCERQQGGEGAAIVHHKKNTNMKDKQWMVKEQLYDCDYVI